MAYPGRGVSIPRIPIGPIHSCRWLGEWVSTRTFSQLSCTARSQRSSCWRLPHPWSCGMRLPQPTLPPSHRRVRLSIQPTRLIRTVRKAFLVRISESWNVSSFEEAECITDYPIAIPTNLPDGFVRAENIIVNKRSTSHFEDRWVEHGWGIPGDPPYGFRLSQHSWKLGLGMVSRP